ncbi:MAG: hypothetical protein AB8B80_08120, partial [Marinicellaceae bacterium]
MNKRKFQMWFMLLVLTIIAVLVYRMLTVETRNAETLAALSKSNIKSLESADVEAENEVVENKSTLPQFTVKEIETILDVLQPHLFHDDPYIEAKLLFEMRPHCRYKKSTIKHQCEAVLTRYNELNALINGFQNLKEIPSNTELGQALKAGMAYDPTQPDIFRHDARHVLKLLIHSENPYVLGFEGGIYQFYGMDYGEILPFSKWLNSQDQEYNRLVLMFSLLKIASGYESTEYGVSNGFMNQMLCSSNRAVCGPDFEATYKKLILPGMQKDVDLMISHLE